MPKKDPPWTPVKRLQTAPTVDKRQRLSGADDWIQRGVWARVKSSNVSAISYDRLNHRLFVAFLTGGVYQYDGVPVRVAADMFYTNSQGRFVWQRLRDRYPYRRLTADTRSGRQSGPRKRARKKRTSKRGGGTW